MHVHILTYEHFFVLVVGFFLHMMETFFFLYSYHNQLKLVRLKVSESGVYTFLASNGDASIHLTFEVHVLSKFYETNTAVLCERNQWHIGSASVNHVTHSSVLLCCYYSVK